MTRWDAFHDLRGAQDQMNQMYRLLTQAHDQEAPGIGATSAPAWAPPVDISERKDAYVLTVELPGVKVEDLDIAFQDGLLTIQGERTLTRDSTDEQFHVLERRYGLFRRSITLPLHVKADAIEASAEDGVLQVVVPKVAEAKPKRIEVHAVRAPVSATAGAPESAPTDVKQEMAGRGDRIDAMREHGHLDAAFNE
ncbi:MAG: Hsp20/alpha crystallin family protein [Pseudonocardiaceae bacterium]